MDRCVYVRRSFWGCWLMLAAAGLCAVFIIQDRRAQGRLVPVAPDGYTIPLGLGDRVFVNGSLVTMSVDPPNKGSRMTSTWKARAAACCADIRLSDAPTNSTVFAMYALSHEVRGEDRLTEPWWELDFEFLGRQMDSVWINWFQAGRTSDQSGFRVLTPPPRGLFRRFCLNWDIDERQATWTVDAEQIANLTMDGTWDAPLSLIFSHWVGQPGNAHWVGGDRIEERVSVDVRPLKAAPA